MFDFSHAVDRHGTWCTQWDYVADRFGSPDLLPFTISDMDFPTAPCVTDALAQRLGHGVFGYSRWKNDDFLSAVAHWYATRFQSNIDTETLVYGPSVIYMVSQLIRQWSAPGDGVLIHTPAYDAFYKTITENGRQVLCSALRFSEGEWRYDPQTFEAQLARPDCKILLLCSPHNPTGKVWRRDELSAMAALCERHGVRVISDEIHMDMVWEGAVHTPWSDVGGENGALLTSASKSFNIPALTGAYGFIFNAQERDAYLAALKGRDGLSSPAVLSLVAHIAAYRHGEPWLNALRGYLEGNLRYVACTLNGAFAQLNWQPPEATYLAWIDLRPLALDDRALQKVLIEQEKTAIMPGYAYGEEGMGYLRLNVGSPRSKVEDGMTRLIRAINHLL